MAKSITFNSFNLQDSNFRTKDIIYRNYPARTIDLEPYPRRDGFRFVNSYYELRDIIVKGTLTRDSEANLKTSLDSLKENLHTEEGNLDINDGGTTLRYVCTVASVNVPEEHYHITRVPYSITFRCQPFGKATSATVDAKTITQASDDPYTSTFDPTGSAEQVPTLKWTLDGDPYTVITQISFVNTTTDDTITVGNLLLDADGDYLEIDCDEMTVKTSYDGGTATEVDYTGVFPIFKASSNAYSVTVTGGGLTWELDQDITYFPQYL